MPSALPPILRVNTTVNFPAMVTGSGPITIAKNNGVWQIGFTIAAFGSQNPPIGNYPTDFLLGFDQVAQQFFKISLSNIVSVVQGARSQRLVTASPIVVAGSDQIINVNISAGAPTCTLPAASTRNGVPLAFKDVGLPGGNFAAHNLTITPSGGDTIDGAASLVLATNHQYVNLVPANDGTTTGWFIE